MFESNESFDSQSIQDESSEDDRMEVAQTSQERRDILERSMIGGALSEDDSQSEASSTDISDQMKGVHNFRSKSVKGSPEGSSDQEFRGSILCDMIEIS